MVAHVRILDVDEKPPLFQPVPAFPHCHRCGEPDPDLVPLSLPVVPYNSTLSVTRELCPSCIVSLREWFLLRSHTKEDEHDTVNDTGDDNQQVPHSSGQA